MRFLGKDIILVAGRSDYSPSLCIDMTLTYCTCRCPPTDTDTDTDLSTLLFSPLDNISAKTTLNTSLSKTKSLKLRLKMKSYDL